MISIDHPIQQFLLDHLSNHLFLDKVMILITSLDVFKGLLPVAMLWCAWFSLKETQWKREMVVASLASGLVSLALGRALAHYLPFRVRPIYAADPSLHFPMSNALGETLRFWSSFPSDHAMIWTSIAFGIFLIWRAVGVVALLHCLLVICLPRVCLGLHYPTDVLCGALIGVLVTWLLTRDGVRQRYAAPVVRFVECYPAVSYMIAFLMCFELATMFNEPRELLQSLVHVI